MTHGENQSNPGENQRELRAYSGMTMNELEKVLEQHGYDVGWTVNLHVIRPDGVSVLVETFDEAGLPALYNSTTEKSAAVSVGGDHGDPVECFEVLEVVEAIEQAGRPA